jgi:hypothetical protein
MAELKLVFWDCFRLIRGFIFSLIHQALRLPSCELFGTESGLKEIIVSEAHPAQWIHV